MQVQLTKENESLIEEYREAVRESMGLQSYDSSATLITNTMLKIQLVEAIGVFTKKKSK